MNYTFNHTTPTKSATVQPPPLSGSSAPSTNSTQNYNYPSHNQNHPQKTNWEFIVSVISIVIAILSGFAAYFINREELRTSITRIEEKQQNSKEQLTEIERKLEKINDSLNKIDKDYVRFRAEYDSKIIKR